MDLSAKIGARIGEKIKPELEPLALVMLFTHKYWVSALADRRILVFRASAWIPSAVKDLVVVLPRSTRFGSISGLWGAFEISGTRYWVH